MTKKVVLLAAGNDFAGNTNVIQFTSLLAPPLGILALGSYLEQHEIPVELIDVQMDFGFGLTRAAERTVSQRVANYLKNMADSISWIGISQLSNSGSGITLGQEINTLLPEIPIIFGGYFPSNTHETLLRGYPFITAIVHGDGEEAAQTISQKLAQGEPFLTPETPNLIWLADNQIHSTPCRPVSLETLPILNLQLLRNPKHYQVIDLMTSRGCPFRCNYCLEKTMRPYSHHSTQWVAQQLAHLETRTPNEHIFIYDPVFGLGKNQTRNLCQVMKQYRFTYAIESRVDVLKPSDFPWLTQARVETIFLGIESASKETLMRMNKVSSKAQAAEYVTSASSILEACFEHGITPVMGFMLNFPGDNEANYQATLEFVQKISQSYAKIANRTGNKVGFAPFAFFTKIYEGSTLAQTVASSFPETLLRSEPFIGERTISMPSPGVDLNTTKRYQTQIARLGEYTPIALDRLERFFSFSMEDFLNDHPRLIDSEGIAVLGDSLGRFSQAFRIDSAFMHYDKSKE